MMLTDLVGFTALTRRDETHALALLEEHRQLVRPLLRTHQGREVKTMGDAFLVEFRSSLDAVRCAIEIQRAMRERNARVAGPRLELRIGLHVGDVVHRDGDVYGDCVNVLSRIEPIADAGGICLSSPVHDQVRHQIRGPFEKVIGPRSKDGDFLPEIFRVVPPGPGRPRTRAPRLVDREEEVERLRSFVELAATRRGGVLFLSGEPGVGKTRLIEEARSYAGQRGVACLVARCSERDRGVPYSTWVEILRKLARQAPRSLLLNAVGPQIAEVSRLVPEIVESADFLPSTTGRDSGLDRARFLGAVAQALADLSESMPMLIVIDDIDTADSASLDLLFAVARQATERPLLLLASYREDSLKENEELARLVFDLQKIHVFSSLPVHPLGRAATLALITEILGPSRVTPESAERLYAKAGGNPFYVEELLGSLTEDGPARGGSLGLDRELSAELQFPPSIRALVDRRLERLDPDSQNLLRVASVLGRDFTFPVLAQVSGMDENRLLEILEAVLRAGFVQERSAVPGPVVYSYVDRQLQEILYESTSLLRRCRIHLRVGEALENLTGGSHPERAAELAFHYLRGNDPKRALQHTARAGDYAAALGAREEAIRHYRIALDLLEEDSTDEALRASLCDRIGDQTAFRAERETAAYYWLRAAVGYERTGNTVQAAEVFRKLWLLTIDVDEAERFHRKARQLLEAEPESPELARLYRSEASNLAGRGEIVEALRISQRALEVARRLNDPVEEAGVYLTLADLVPATDRWSVGHYLDRATELVSRYHLHALVPGVYYRLGLAALNIRGSPDQAVEWFHKGAEYARRICDREWEAQLDLFLCAYASLRKGNLDQAQQLAERFDEFSQKHHLSGTAAVDVLLANLALLHGYDHEGQELLDRAMSAGPEPVNWFITSWLLVTRGRFRLDREDLTGAAADLRKARELSRAAGVPALTAVVYAEALALSVTVAIRAGDRENALAYVAELRELAKGFEEEAVRGYRFEAEAHVAVHSGTPDQASTLFRRSAEVWSQLGWEFQLARTLREWGGVRQHADDPELAQSLLSRAAELYDRMGARRDPSEAGSRPPSPIVGHRSPESSR